jgi:hypothetical protein
MTKTNKFIGHRPAQPACDTGYQNDIIA